MILSSLVHLHQIYKNDYVPFHPENIHEANIYIQEEQLQHVFTLQQIEIKMPISLGSDNRKGNKDTAHSECLP